MEQRQVTYEHVSPVRPSVHPPHRESRVCMPKRRPVPVYNWDNVDASRSEVNAYLFYIKSKHHHSNLISRSSYDDALSRE